MGEKKRENKRKREKEKERERKKERKSEMRGCPRRGLLLGGYMHPAVSDGKVISDMIVGVDEVVMGKRKRRKRKE